jgi:Fe-S-cluster containining protein
VTTGAGPDTGARALLKLAARARYGFDLAVTRLVGRLLGRPRFVLAGACHRCGGCCSTPMIRLGLLGWYAPTLRRLTVAWHRRVNRFELVGTDRESRSLVFRCLHYDAATGSCDAYTTRPGFCRDYPRPLLDGPDPTFIGGCGFRAVDRHAARLSAILDGQDLDPAQRDELDRRLHLR